MLPVVVCGAGPVGLVLALELAAWQVPVLLVERHRLPSSFPRGRVIGTRSMEILRQLGLEREVTEIGLPRIETTHFFAGASLTAPEFGRVGAPLARGETVVSPTAALGCPQDRFEALLRQRIVDNSLVDARFGTELLDAEQRADHVEVRLSGSGGSDTTVGTSWLVGADGPRSRVRHLAGISMDTLGAPCSNVNILIDADLKPLVGDRISLVYDISNSDVHALVLTVCPGQRSQTQRLIGEQRHNPGQWVDDRARSARRPPRSVERRPERHQLLPILEGRSQRAAAESGHLGSDGITGEPVPAARPIPEDHPPGRGVVTGARRQPHGPNPRHLPLIAPQHGNPQPPQSGPKATGPRAAPTRGPPPGHGISEQREAIRHLRGDHRDSVENRIQGRFTAREWHWVLEHCYPLPRRAAPAVRRPRQRR